jgi:hypothetical protein
MAVVAGLVVEELGFVGYCTFVDRRVRTRRPAGVFPRGTAFGRIYNRAGNESIQHE